MISYCLHEIKIYSVMILLAGKKKSWHRLGSCEEFFIWGLWSTAHEYRQVWIFGLCCQENGVVDGLAKATFSDVVESEICFLCITFIIRSVTLWALHCAVNKVCDQMGSLMWAWVCIHCFLYFKLEAWSLDVKCVNDFRNLKMLLI